MAVRSRSPPKPKTRNPKPETRNSKPETRNPKPETRNQKFETVVPAAELRQLTPLPPLQGFTHPSGKLLNRKPPREILDPEPQTSLGNFNPQILTPPNLNPNPSPFRETLNPKPQTLNPEPQTLNPEPQTLNPES